jgi:lipoprotein-anchoring transpeptidase ErfK/SrfK
MIQSLGRHGMNVRRTSIVAAIAILTTIITTTAATAQAFSYADEQPNSLGLNNGLGSAPATGGDDTSILPPRLQRQIVNYSTREAPGTIVIDTPNTVLYYVLGNNRAVRYGVGVGREGFTWSGTQTISRKTEWPDWHPPVAMIARQPYLPRFMAGGPGNPLGARAMYLGSSEYRIHGTNDPSTIGKFVSSGCIRLTNTDVADLFSRVSVGTKVVVLPKSGGHHFEARGAGAARAEAPRLPTQATLLQQVANQPGSGLY